MRLKPLDAAEEQFIETNIGLLNQKQKDGVYDIVKSDCAQNQEKEDVFEFELNMLLPETARTLKYYIENCKLHTEKDQLNDQVKD